MNRLVIIMCLCPMLAFGQISFIREHATNVYAQQVSRPYELSNGNFICSVVHGKNNIWFTVLYLFSECGDLITTLHVSTPDEVMLINNFVQIDSNAFLATGWVYDTVLHSVYLVLNVNTLDVLKERRYYETGSYVIDKSFIESGRIYQLGSFSGSLFSSSLNANLVRNFHVHNVFNRDEYPGLTWMTSSAYSKNRLYSVENYRDTTNEYYSILRCLDGKLREVYHIQTNTDSIYTSFEETIGYLGGDTLLVGAVERGRFGDSYQRYIRRFYRDSLLYEKAVQGFESFFDYSTCTNLGGILRCIKSDGKIAEFDTYGERVFYTNHLTEILGQSDMIGAITTQDGGVFAATDSYLQVDGAWVEVLKIVKTTKDYQISETPHPTCIVATQDLHVHPNIVIYPNPATSTIHIASEEPVLQYRVYSTESKLLISGLTHENEFDIDFDLLPGMYVIQIETQKGWFTQKLLIVN